MYGYSLHYGGLCGTMLAVPEIGFKFSSKDYVMLVNVEQRHIDNGEIIDPCSCPIALALKDVVKDDLFVTVGAGYVTFFRGAYVVNEFRVTLQMRNFIDAFDGSDSPHNPNKPKPFSFEADIPAEHLK